MSALPATSARLSVRGATTSDIPFLAHIEEIASTPPFPESMWAPCLRPTGTGVQAFAAAMYAEGASRWGDVGDFIVVERDGAAIAACAVYEPAADETDRRSLRLDRLPAVAARLGWDDPTQAAFREAYDAAWGASGPWLTPRAPAIIETVGVLPEGRGLGIGKTLMAAAFDRARALGHAEIGVSVILGNERGRKLYDSVGFEPVMTFHTAFFDGAFPGFAKLRRGL